MSVDVSRAVTSSTSIGAPAFVRMRMNKPLMLSRAITLPWICGPVRL